MYWAGDSSMPCWASPYLSDGAIYTMAKTERDWTKPFIAFAAKGRVEPKIIGHDIMATPATWAALGAYNLARAYRPEGLP